MLAKLGRRLLFRGARRFAARARRFAAGRRFRFSGRQFAFGVQLARVGFAVGGRRVALFPGGVGLNFGELGLHARTVGGGSQGDGLFGGEVADAGVLRFVGVLRQRRVQRRVRRSRRHSDLQDFDLLGGFVQPAFAVDTLHQLRQFGVRLGRFQRDVAVPGSGYLLEQRLALARHFAGARRIRFVARFVVEVLGEQLPSARAARFLLGQLAVLGSFLHLGRAAPAFVFFADRAQQP